MEREKMSVRNRHSVRSGTYVKPILAELGQKLHGLTGWNPEQKDEEDSRSCKRLNMTILD
jgi:hypothetical protein